MTQPRFAIHGALAAEEGVVRSMPLASETAASRTIDAALARCGDPAVAVPAEGARFCFGSGRGLALGLAISAADRTGQRQPLAAWTQVPADRAHEHAALPAVVGPHMVSWRAALRAGAERSLASVQARLAVLPPLDPAPLACTARGLRLLGALEHADRVSWARGERTAAALVDTMQLAERATRHGRGPTLVAPIACGRDAAHLLALLAALRGHDAPPPAFAWTSRRLVIALGAPVTVFRALRAPRDEQTVWSLDAIGAGWLERRMS